jgi:hypothetical protein
MKAAARAMNSWALALLNDEARNCAMCTRACWVGG